MDENLFPERQQLGHTGVFETKDGNTTHFLSKQLNRTEEVACIAQGFHIFCFNRREIAPVATNSSQHLDVQRI